MNLLIVDDEQIVINGILSGVDFAICGIKQVFTVNSVSQAKAILEREEVSLVLSDIEMPRASGLDLLRFVRNAYPKVACALLTCHAEFAYAKEAIHLGCVEYLLKPVVNSEIADLLTKMVEEFTKNSDIVEKAEIGKVWLGGKKQEESQAHGEKLNKEDLVKEVQKYLLDHISDESLSLTSIADAFHRNQDHLNRIFKSVTGETIIHQIIACRMKMAAGLLAEGRFSSAAIARMCGYENYGHFVASFKKAYGKSPTAYAKAKGFMGGATGRG
ncbi:MAG: response regulator [Clostridiales bacterium]|jgi:YesN/AraC family two-component response regulator|nr:response regulator [Clostridiales bacterium]